MVNDKPRKISVLANVWDGSNEVLVGYVAYVYSNGHNVVFYKPIEKVKPIPITAEVLVKNDFVRRSDEFSIYEYTTLLGKILRTTQVFLTTPLSINVFLHDTTIERGYIHREITSVSILRNELYVHDLQHALRLAGVDKEINL